MMCCVNHAVLVECGATAALAVGAFMPGILPAAPPAVCHLAAGQPQRVSQGGGGPQRLVLHSSEHHGGWGRGGEGLGTGGELQAPSLRATHARWISGCSATMPSLLLSIPVPQVDADTPLAPFWSPASNEARFYTSWDMRNWR